MDAREQEILRHFERGPAEVRPLLARSPTSSVYRAIKRLLKQNLLRKEGSKYSLTPLGLETVAPSMTPSVSSEVSGLAKALPHVVHAPTPFHRSLLELIACARVARLHRLRPGHHASFVLFGKKLRWKTWIPKAASWMAGCDPASSVLYLASESGRSLITRKNSRGDRLSYREALGMPIVGLDEYLRAPKEVRASVHLYLHGELEIPDENGRTLQITPVPIVTMNPKKQAADLEERLCLDEGLIRRSILADFSGVEIPLDIAGEGDARLDQIRALGPAEFPEPRSRGWDPQKSVEKVLLATLAKPDLLAEIDLVMISMLVQAATAWLDEDDAVNEVLTAFFTVVAELGWTRADWRTHMQPQSKPTPPAPVIVPDANPLDYDAKLHDLADVCARMGMDAAEAERLLELVRALGDVGFEPEDADVLAAELERVDIEMPDAMRALADAIQNHENLASSAEARAKRVAELKRTAAAESARLEALRTEAKSLGVEPARLKALGTLHDALEESQLGVDDVQHVATAARELAAAMEGNVPEAAHIATKVLASLAKEIKSLAKRDVEAAKVLGRLVAT